MTSNLIALWSLREKEREANETIRHNLETEAAAKRRERIDEDIAKMNYAISKFNAITSRYAAEKNANIALLNYNLGLLNQQTAEKRIASDEKIAAMKLEQQERERVTNSYLTQRNQNIQERHYKSQDVVNTQNYELNWKKWYTGTLLDFTNMIVGGLALNESRKRK